MRPQRDAMKVSTVADRVLVHLSGFARYANEIECPVDVTQEGIGSALGLSRSHVALELKRQLALGRAIQRLAHIRGSRHRRKAYFLTPAGHRRAAEIIAEAKARTITVTFPDGDRRDLSGAAAVAALVRAGAREHEAVLRILDADSVVLSGGPGPAGSAKPVGREREIAELRAFAAAGRGLLAVAGPAGIGKSTLVAAALAGHPGPWVWVRCLEGDGRDVVIREIARHLDARGRTALTDRVARREFGAEAVEAVVAEARGLVVALDDADRSPDAQAFARACAGAGARVAFVLVARRPFPWPADRTLEVGALDAASSEEVLRGLRPDLPAALRWAMLQGCGGHALLLEIAARGELPSERTPLGDALSRLDDRQRTALEAAAVYDGAFPSEALPRAYVPLRELAARGLVSTLPDGFLVPGLVRARVLGDLDRGTLHALHSDAATYFAGDRNTIREAAHLLRADRVAEAAAKVARDLERMMEEGRAPSALALLEECARRDVDDDTYAVARMDLAADAGFLETARLVAVRLRSAADPRLRLRAALVEGRALLTRGDLEAAREPFTLARRLAGNLEDLRSQGRAFLGLGEIARRSGDLRESVETLRRAERLLATAHDRRWALEAKLARVRAIAALGDVDRALSEIRPYLRAPGEPGARAAEVQRDLLPPPAPLADPLVPMEGTLPGLHNNH